LIQAWFRQVKEKRAAARLQAKWRCYRARKSYLQVSRSGALLVSSVRSFLEIRRPQHAAAASIQRAWVVSQERFLRRCLLVLQRTKSAIVVQRWWTQVQLSRCQQKIKLSFAKERKSTALPFDTECWAAQAKRLQFCDPASMPLFCNFDFGVLSRGVSDLMPWSNNVEVVNDAIEQGRAKMVKEHTKKIRSALLIQRFYRDMKSKRTKVRPGLFSQIGKLRDVVCAAFSHPFSFSCLIDSYF